MDSTDHPRGASGILDFTQPENPFRDHTAVLIPYCTGDAHLGTREVAYSSADSTAQFFQIHHTGYANVRSALDWVFESMPNPEVVFVAGSSAGAIASPYYAVLIAEHYPRARIVQLGDAAGGYRAAALPQLMATWGATDRVRRDGEYRDVDSTAMSFVALYTHAGRSASKIQFAQLNSLEDATQLRFLALVGVRGVPLRTLLSQNLTEIHQAVPSFRAFTAPGSTHTFLRSPEFYALEVDGVRLRDWVKALAEGRPVKDVGGRFLSTR